MRRERSTDSEILVAARRTERLAPSTHTTRPFGWPVATTPSQRPRRRTTDMALGEPNPVRQGALATRGPPGRLCSGALRPPRTCTISRRSPAMAALAACATEAAPRASNWGLYPGAAARRASERRPPLRRARLERRPDTSPRPAASVALMSTGRKWRTAFGGPSAKPATGAAARREPRSS